MSFTDVAMFVFYTFSLLFILKTFPFRRQD
jgi:hypothetical protein